MYILICKYKYLFTYTYMNIYIYTSTCTHTHTHTHTLHYITLLFIALHYITVCTYVRIHIKKIEKSFQDDIEDVFFCRWCYTHTHNYPKKGHGLTSFSHWITQTNRQPPMAHGHSRARRGRGNAPGAGRRPQPQRGRPSIGCDDVVAIVYFLKGEIEW